jgi:hypothetical protein
VCAFLAMAARLSGWSFASRESVRLEQGEMTVNILLNVQCVDRKLQLKRLKNN